MNNTITHKLMRYQRAMIPGQWMPVRIVTISGQPVLETDARATHPGPGPKSTLIELRKGSDINRLAAKLMETYE